MGRRIQKGGARTKYDLWLKMVERLRRETSGWAPDELPVEMIQTHISVVLLGWRHVLKLKKPVNFGFLDYTTLGKRRRSCEAEINLNRRLCPEIYLRVQPVAEVEGQFRLSDAGRVVDYGVWMKRLPDERMLDQMVEKDVVTESIIDRVADRLSAFHQGARRGPDVDAYGSPEAIRRNWGICDGHGDVRCESICVTDGICIFDCIEFNDRFRCGDVASEVAFLAMDLDARGRPDLGYYFAERYQMHTADPRLLDLLVFYKCYRAFVRGKVLGFRLDEPEFSDAAKECASIRAESYFDLALRYATPLKAPTVIAVAGLSGIGKTSLARAVAGELGLRVASSDAVRAALFGNAKGAFPYGEGVYCDEANRLTYRALADMGRSWLREDGGVILDATFRRAADRETARQMAETFGARWRLIECCLPADLTRRRLEQRVARGEGLSDAKWETTMRQRDEFERADDLSGAACLALETSGSLSAISKTATDWLRASDGHA